MCDRKQVTNVLCKDKQATIVICKGYITAFHEKIPEPRRMQCRGIRVSSRSGPDGHAP